eukprot:Awhi_evm1s5981
MGRHVGSYLKTGETGGTRHAFLTCIGEGLLAYGTVYSAIGEALKSVMNASADGTEQITLSIYGEEAAKTVRTTGSISKDVAIIAYETYSCLGLSTPAKAFGKGLVK